jgi:DNA-binding NarL/FixJ family response regulator
VLQTSSMLAGVGPIQDSWFEDDPDIARTMSSGRGRNRPKLVAYLLQSAIARHRNRWADLFLRMALWMHEAPPETGLSWRELAIVAKALAEGRDLGEIGLMRDIALRTIAAHTDRTHV